MSLSAVKERAEGPRRSTLVRRVLGVVVAVIVAFWLFGAVLFLRADGSVDYTLPARQRQPAAEHNLASYLYGPRVRASSYYRDSTSHHHPMFLVDALPLPSLAEKWVCDMRDRKPWFSVTWREPRTLKRVRLQHGGLREAAWFTARNYTLRCLTERGTGSELKVQNNKQHLVEHALTCSDARGLRVDFLRGPKDDVVRLFEIEAWGQ